MNALALAARSVPGVLGLGGALLGVWLSSACGGRAVTVEGEGGSEAVASGGATFGGSVGRAGSGAQAGTAGCSSGCSNIACATGSTLMSLPGSCCPICVPNMPCGGPCPVPMCGAGFHPEVTEGNCCPTCVADPIDESCAKGRATYATISQQVITKYQSIPCRVAGDCAVVSLINACSSSCQPVAVSSSLSASLLDFLSQESMMDCFSCGPVPDIACGTPAPACSAGQCVADWSIPPP